MNKWLKKRDIILIAALLFVGVIFLIIWQFVYSKSGNYITIEQRGSIIGTYPLNKDTTIPILYKNEGVNEVVIEDGVAYMNSAECPDHLCIKQGKIDKVGQTIVCMPNRVVVTVVGDGGLDSVAK